MVALLLAGCSGRTEATLPSVTAPPAGTAPAAPRPPMSFASCGSGVECATLAVPVDHDRPDGPTVDLAVARRGAADRARRLGTVVVNPGGPGGSGVDLVRGGSLGGLDRFDVVSWDPRGVGGSRPLACDDALPAYRTKDWSPDDGAERAALDEGARTIAEDCRRAAGELVDHLATEDTARDLDVLRRALGDERLNFVGFSYGTALGLTYLDLFPERVRAMVLDGVADPREDLGTFLLAQSRALETQVAEALGPQVADYDRLRREAEAGRAPVNATTLAYAAIASSYHPDGATLLRDALAAAGRGDGSPLGSLAQSYWRSAAFGPYAAVTCSDQPHPDGPREFDELADELARAAPRFGAVMANELRVCAWWPTTAPVPAIRPGRGAPTVLVLGNTGDVATPYDSAVRVANDLGDQGALVTYEGEGHTSLGRSTCVDGHARRYLEELVRPPAGARCR